MTTPTFETLLYAVEDGIATITLNRPDKMNAFNNVMMKELIEVFDLTDADDDVRCVIVTGAGKAFCAGADLSNAGGSTFDYTRANIPAHQIIVDGIRRDGGGRVALRIYDSLKPVIAAVNGAAVGVGVTMQLPMDIRLSVEGAKFGFVFTRRGITPEATSSFFLPRLVGMQTALEWCYTGRIFLSEEARERGLVRSLHKPEDLMPAARAIAREIADNTSPVSVALTRQLMYRGLEGNHPMDAHNADSRSLHYRGTQADVREGVASFMEKRPAVWPDKVSTDMPNPWPKRKQREFE